MNKKLLLTDLALCSLWALAVLGSRAWGMQLGYQMSLLLVLVMMRITLSFALYRRDRKAWMPWVLQTVLAVPFIQAGRNFEMYRLINMPFQVLGISLVPSARILFRCLLMAWFWLMPVGVYAWYMLRKRWARQGMRWTEVMGALLWHDRSARLYSKLMLLAVLALLAGLAMDMRMACFACVVAPVLSLMVLSRHYGVEVKHIWIAAASMVVFYLCQDTAGMWRVALLAISFVPVVYLCSNFFRQKGMVRLTLASILYIGVLLPCLSIGNNPYACLKYARDGFYYVAPYSGVLVVEDEGTGKVGLRDRYGLLVEPEYDSWTWHDSRRWFGQLELRRNGYFMLYDICNDRLSKGDGLDHELQDSLCMVMDSHMASHTYAFNDRLEVSVKDCIKGKLLAHVRMVCNGGPLYHYDRETREAFIKNGADTLQAGSFVCDTVYIEKCLLKQMAHAVQNGCRDSVQVYTIDVKSARDEQPREEEVRGLMDAIASLLRGWDK